MKYLKYLVVVVLAALVLLPVLSACAPTPSPTPTPTPGPTVTPTKPGLPEVPITYPGDTDETIIRRAQWIEGAKKEGKVSWWGILKPAEALEVIVEFNKVYPFIKVDYWRGKGEEVAAKFEAEFIADRSVVDVCLGGKPDNYPRWREMGVMTSFVDIVPKSGLEMLDEKQIGTYGDDIIPALAPKIPQYNTNLVSAAEAPKSWEDLLDPKWKGHMGMEMGQDDWAYFAMADGGWGIDKTEQFLIKLKEQEPRFIKGGTAAHGLLIAGEFKVMAMGNLRHVLLSQQKDAPVDWVRVSPVLVTGPSLIMPRKQPHPNAGKLLMEWLLSPQGLQVFAEVSQNYVPGADTPIAKLLEGRPLAVRTEEAIIEAIELDLIHRFDAIMHPGLF